MKKTLSPAQIALIKKKIIELNDDPFQNIEFTDAEMDLDLSLDIDIDIHIDTDFDFTALPPRAAKPTRPRALCPGTRKISIRVSNAVLNAFRDQAKRKGTKPQTLINRVLKEQSKGW